MSTRRGNAGAWLPILGRTPSGVWGLALPPTAEAAAWFTRGEIDDFLLVVTYTGRTPPF